MALLHDMEIDDYLNKCVKVFPETLEDEFIRLPSDFAYWSERHAVALRAHLAAKVAVDQAKVVVEHTEARLRRECQEALEEEGKRATIPAIDAAVGAHPALARAKAAQVAATQTAVDAEVERRRLAGVLDAISIKRDMLIQLGAQHRAEMERDPVVRERQRARREE